MFNGKPPYWTDGRKEGKVGAWQVIRMIGRSGSENTRAKTEPQLRRGSLLTEVL